MQTTRGGEARGGSFINTEGHKRPTPNKHFCIYSVQFYFEDNLTVFPSRSAIYSERKCSEKTFFCLDGFLIKCNTYHTFAN